MTVLELLSPRERQVYCRRIFRVKLLDIAAELGISKEAVAVTWRNAKDRILRWEPSRDAVDGLRERRAANRENSLAWAPRCTRCHLRGHVAGDPDRCLRPARFYALHAAVTE